MTYLALAATLFWTASTAPTPPPNASVFSSATVLHAINTERARANLPALAADHTLQTAAQQWAELAARRQSLIHRKDLQALTSSNGWGTVNENLYAGTGPMTPSRVVRAWMASPGHRKNLLAPRITVAGIGIASSAQGTTYVVFNGAGP